VPREGHIGNPSQQARRAADALERYLQKRGVHQSVQPLVVFTHPNVELSIEQPTVAIVRANETLNLVSRQPQRLAADEVKQVVDTLRKLRPIEQVARHR
jgi:hypothetical protein